MSQTSPWTSAASNVYHNHNECHHGNKVDRKNIIHGKGGKSLCQVCAELNRKRK